MKTKKLLSIFTMLTMLLALLPSIPASAAVSYTMRFKRVTSVDEITSGLGVKYLIVGYEGEDSGGRYFALSNEATNIYSGRRTGVEFSKNEDGTLSLPENISNYSVFDMKITEDYIKGSYKFQDESGYYFLQGFYKSYAVTHDYSKSLPREPATYGYSAWQPIFRNDGTVLFKTTKSGDSYIRMYHPQDSDDPYFSGGALDDENIDLPDGMTQNDLTEDNIPVKTYLYKEVCAHDESNLQYIPAKGSTCSEQGNMEYYKCSYCGAYLAADKNTEITYEQTLLPLAEHENTTFVPAAEPTCSAHGNIAYTYCADCGKYFKGDSTDIPIIQKDTVIISVNHSYTDGVCIYCHESSESKYFSRYGTTGNGNRYIFAAEYDGKVYAMGDINAKGMSAVEITGVNADILYASSEAAVFTEEVSYGQQVKLNGTGTYYTPIYVKVGENYLKNDAQKLTLVSDKEDATYWYSNYSSGESYGNILKDDTQGGTICLVTNDGTPYFTISDSADEYHIVAYRFGEQCTHDEGLVHTPGIDATCTKDGLHENWYCGVCGRYFTDEQGVNTIDEMDLPILADGAKDEDDDGICDFCGRNMPIYTEVTDENEIVVGNKYILVAKVEGKFYVLKTPEPDKAGTYYNIGSTLPAGRITQEDGVFKYNTAYNAGAHVIKLEFANECSDLDEGGIRYGLAANVRNKSVNLEDYDGFIMENMPAKYGWRIGINSGLEGRLAEYNGSVKMSSAYSEDMAAWSAGVGKMCLYRLTETTEKDSITTTWFFSTSESSEHTKEGSIIRFPVYLYRLTETGTVNNRKYRLNDVKSTVSKNEAELPSEAAADLSNVEGVSQALKTKAVEEFAQKIAGADDVSMNIDVNIAVSEYIASDKETRSGGSITYSISPKINIISGSQEQQEAIPDDAFDGSPMRITLYTGGINPKQIIHKKQDGTKEYFYEEYSEEVMQKGEKAFTLKYDNSGNSYVNFEVTEFSDIIILETPIEYSITGYNEKERYITVSCPAAGEYSVIYANYEKGTLTGVEISHENIGEGEKNMVYLPKNVYLNPGDKIFLWGEDVSNMRPLCPAYTME